MSTYRLELPANSVTALDFDAFILAKQMAKHSKLSVNELLIKIHRAPYENTSLKSLWHGENELSFNFNTEAIDDFDINIVGTFIVLKMLAYKVLEPIMADFGEFINVQTDRGEMMLFNLLTFAKEDMLLTEQKFLDGFEDGLSSLVFDKDDIAKKSIFKSKLAGGNLIYCNTAFYNAVKKYQFTGVTFYTDLLSIFPEK